MFCAIFLSASDLITIDSVFKKNSGIRSITSIDIITANNSRTFSSYPNIYSYDDGENITESREMVLNQTILYGYNYNLDIIISASYLNKETSYIKDGKLDSKSSGRADSLWLGFKYDLPVIANQFKPNITVQTALSQKTKYRDDVSEDSLKNHIIKLNIRHYSDPLISSLSIETTQNQEREVGNIDIELGNSYGIGLLLSVVLNPKVSLNFGFENRYQEGLKEDGVKVNENTILSSINLGATYGIGEFNAFTISSKTGTSSNSPNSIISFSLWHKF